MSTWRLPGSQGRAVMEAKRNEARRLLAHGLTVSQVCQQVRLSPQVVRQVRDESCALAEVPLE